MELGNIASILNLTISWNNFIKTPSKLAGQNETGRLWDVLNALRYEARKQNEPEILFAVYIQMRNNKKQLVKLLNHKKLHAWELLSLLNDTRRAKEKDLPDTGVGIEWEKVLSSVFIQSPNYGTRCSTAVLIDNNNNVRFAEKTFLGNQGSFSNKDYNFRIEKN